MVLCTILVTKQHIFLSIDQYTMGISWHAVKIRALGAKEVEKAHADIDEWWREVSVSISRGGIVHHISYKFLTLKVAHSHTPLTPGECLPSRCNQGLPPKGGGDAPQHEDSPEEARAFDFERWGYTGRLQEFTG